MTRRAAALPFGRDGSGRFLPWLIALMVYLAALATAGALAAAHALDAWERGLEGTLTVELPPAPSGAHDLSAALAVLNGTPGVRSAHALTHAEVAALVEPWLGSDLPRELELPRLIDVQLAPHSPPDLDALRLHLARAAPGTEIEDRSPWLAPAAALVHGAEAAAFGIVLLVGAAAVLSVVFATRTGLALHRELIDLLHLMGARDAYIIAAFERRALRLGLVGGVLGLMLAAITLLPLGRLAAADGVGLAPWHYAIIAVLPVVAAVLAVATARHTVGRALARMP